MKVFLDIGAHTGQTLQAALRWNFNRIVCFEPVKKHRKGLLKMADLRTSISPFGLWNKTEMMPLYDPGSQGSSLWQRPGRRADYELCQFMRATDWMRANLFQGDEIWMKINAEGAECDILTDLLESDELSRISYTLVMWDAHKIPAIASREAEVRDRVAERFPAPRVMSSKQIPPADTHTGRIDNWLGMSGLLEKK